MDKYEVYKLHCDKCNNEWDEIANSTTEDRFVFTSRKKYLPAMLMFRALFFNEVWSLIKENTKKSGMSKNDVAGKFHKILGLISDPAADGTHYSMMTDYICPKCGSNDVDFGPKNPPEARMEDLPELAHKHWDSLDEKQKKKLIQKHLHAMQ